MKALKLGEMEMPIDWSRRNYNWRCVVIQHTLLKLRRDKKVKELLKKYAKEELDEKAIVTS